MIDESAAAGAVDKYLSGAAPGAVDRQPAALQFRFQKPHRPKETTCSTTHPSSSLVRST